MKYELLWPATLVVLLGCAFVVRYAQYKSVAIIATVTATLTGFVMAFILPPTDMAWTILLDVWMVSLLVAWLDRGRMMQLKSGARQ